MLRYRFYVRFRDTFTYTFRVMRLGLAQLSCVLREKFDSLVRAVKLLLSKPIGVGLSSLTVSRSVPIATVVRGLDNVRFFVADNEFVCNGCFTILMKSLAAHDCK